MSRAAVLVVAVGTVAVGLGASIGFLHGFLATQLRGELSVSRAAVGLLVSVYFGSTGLGSVAGGVVTDRLGARLAVALDLAVVALAAAAIALWPSYRVLLVASVAAGFGYALCNAGTNVAIGAAVPPSVRGVALTVKTAGVPLMAVAGAFVAPWAGLRFGWPWVFAAVAVLAAAACAAALVTLPADRPAAGSLVERAALPRGFAWFPVAAFLMIAGTQPLFSWTVPFFTEAVRVDPATAGRLVSVATAVGVVAMVLVARRSDQLGAGRRVWMIRTLCLVCAAGVAVLAAGAALGAAVGLVGTMVGLGTQLAAVGLLHAAIVDAVPLAVGRASGVTMTGYYLGALASPLGFGALVDLTGFYAVPWAVAFVLLLLAALAFARAPAPALVPEAV